MSQTTPYQSLELRRVVLVFIYLTIAVWYLTWRLGTFNPDALTFSISLYSAEVYGFFATLMHIFMTWRLSIRRPPPVPEGQSVDVFISTINEPVTILRRTLVNAIGMHYPHRTWLLDDGRRPEMEALAKDLGCNYLARADNKDAKAGNLNHALEHSTGDFIAVFDADHAPNRNFLLRTLGYFQDDTVAIVQTPQDFYNLDSFQHHKKKNKALAWHEQSVFFRVIQRGKDYWNAAFFCGSCAVIRRSALQVIGGFAIGTVTEDLHTSVKLHKQGFQSVYHAESLAFGLAPASVVSFLKQRIRWGQGAMQVWRQEGVFFCRGLTMAQRINYLASSITYFDGWQKGLFYMTPVIALTTGIMPLNTIDSEFFLHFIPYFLLTFWVFEEVNRGYGRSIVIEQYNMVRFAAMAWSTLAFFRKALPFSVTPKGTAPSPQSLLYMAPQRIILVLNFVAIFVGAVLYHYEIMPLTSLLACTVWATVNFLLAASMLLFSKVKSSFKREEYRFPIPLPAKLLLNNGTSTEVYGIVDDISATGFRFYASFPETVQLGQAIEGKIFLPEGPVDLHGEIRALIPGTTENSSYVKAIGCSFKWDNRQEEEKLDLFLYGTDVERQIHGLQETILTPFDHITTAGSNGNPEPHVDKSHWAAMLYSQNGNTQNKPRVGLVSISNGSDGPRQMLVFTPLEENTLVKLDIHSRSDVSELSGTIHMSKKMNTSALSIFCYELTPERESSS